MQRSPEDILCFAQMIAWGSHQPWGENWRVREIDGFFYLEFVNPDFKRELVLERMKVSPNLEGKPPYPCRWDADENPSEYVLPGRGRSPRPDENLSLLDRANGLNSVSWTYGVEYEYLEGAFLHGTPVPFTKYMATFQWNERPPLQLVYILVISGRLKDSDWARIRGHYAQWLKEFGLASSDDESLGFPSIT